MVEKKRIRITEGIHNSSEPKGSKISHFSTCYAFTQQLDILVPFSPEIRDELKNLTTRYYTREISLSAFLASAPAYVEKYSASSQLVAIGQPSHDSDDVWCLDTRGLLTLAVGKYTYEELGLVGERLPWKPCQETYIIRIFLSEISPDTRDAKAQHWHPLGMKQKNLLKSWDQRRGPWRVLLAYGSSDAILPNNNHSELVLHEVLPSIYHFSNANIPVFDLSHSPPDARVDDDWEEEVHAYFEWVGMACLGSERLRENDDVDPYIAVYDPPFLARKGDLIHVRWTGLLHSTFVQQVLDFALKAPVPFAALVGHNITISPVTYLSPPPRSLSPPRMPQADSEDTRALLLSHTDSSDGSSDVRWMVAESIGQWDARWG